jgi:HSP20 family protein
MSGLLPTLRRTNWLRHPEWDLFDRFFEDFRLPSLFSEEGTFEPAFDVSETEKELIVKAEVPGMKKEDISIDLSNGLLTVKGEKKHEKKKEHENYHCVERRYGTFLRTMRLPVEVDTDKVDATYKDGLLTITVPKSEAAKPKKVEVH